MNYVKDQVEDQFLEHTMDQVRDLFKDRPRYQVRFGVSYQIHHHDYRAWITSQLKEEVQ